MHRLRRAEANPVKEFIDNPRHAPRIPARFRVAVASQGEGFAAETEDVGPGGCLLLTPRPLGRGIHLRLAISSGQAGADLSVLGHVAWTGAGANRPRAGIAYEERQAGATRPDLWFDQLLKTRRILPGRVPERLDVDGLLYLLPPPRHIVDFDDGEVRVLRRIGSGATLRHLMEGAPPERSQVVIRSIFSLFEKRALTLSLGQSAAAWLWAPVLSTFAAEAAGDGVAPQPARRPEPAVQPGPVPDPLVPMAAAAGSSTIVPTTVAAPVRPVAETAPKGPSPHESQVLLEQTRRISEEGNYHEAIPLLRRALLLSPRDPEIAKLLGECAFRGRAPHA
jgi:hypothetical protein